MSIFRVDADIRKAKTLSSSFYTDDEYFEKSKEQIFSKCWQFIGVERGDSNLIPHTFLEGFVDEPILIATDRKGVRHCVSNVCTHRGKLLVETPQNSSRIRCGYHGRCFSLDGKFISMPEFEETEDFPTPQDNLRRIDLDYWNDLAFVSLGGTRILEDFIGEMRRRTGHIDFQRLRLVGIKEYQVRAHWALYCENYLEGLHIPFVHKGLNQEVEFSTYATEIFPYSSLQTGRDETSEIVAQYYFVFPNMMFNFYPWGLSVNVVKPVSKNQSSVFYYTLVNNEKKISTGAGADLETVEIEDQAVVESVQRGVRSRFYDQGRYSPTREQGTHHFHRLICEFMA